MEKLHLNYDGKQTNGIIFNDKYPKGALYIGAELKPKLSFIYDSMQYSEVFDNPNYVEVNKTKRVMTDKECAEVINMASTWKQALGQEGNPNLEQKKAIHYAEWKQKELQKADDVLYARYKKEMKAEIDRFVV